MKVQRARGLIGAVIATLCLTWAWKSANTGELLRALASIDIRWSAMGVLAFACGYLCRAIRWNRMLRRANPDLAWWLCVGPLLAGTAVNNMLPLRAGDVLRATAFDRVLGAPTSTVIASLIAERLLDVAALVCALVFALLLLPSMAIHRLVPVVIGCVLFIVAAALLLVSGSAPAQRFFSRLSRNRPRWTDPAARALQSTANAWRKLGLQSIGRSLAGWTVAAWAFEGAVFWCAAQAIPSLTARWGAWLAMPVATLATMIPGGPGHVGTFDVGAMQAMVQTGNCAEASLAFAALVHLILWLPATIAGGGFLLSASLAGSAR